MEKTGKITLLEVSKAANVSLNTAAKVLAGQAKKARISEKTAKKVRKIAKKLGYIPNLMARNLRSQKTGTIGVFIADMSDSAYSSSSQIILKKLHDKGFLPLLTVAEIGLELCMQEWLQNRIEGLILCGTTEQMTTAFFDKIRKSQIKAVVAGCTYRDPNNPNTQLPEVSTVSMDNQIGMQLAVNHLIEQKRKKIVHVAGPHWQADAYERQTAYENTIKQYHKPIIIGQAVTERFWRRGYCSAAKLENADGNIDAIIAYDDQVAIGAIKWLTENGRKIPDDIAIVGFDNSPESEFCTPSLTTIAQPTEAIAEKAVSLLESSLYSQAPIEKIQIRPSLVVRKSSRC